MKTLKRETVDIGENTVLETVINGKRAVVIIPWDDDEAVVIDDIEDCYSDSDILWKVFESCGCDDDIG